MNTLHSAASWHTRPLGHRIDTAPTIDGSPDLTALVARIAAGDQAALSQLYARSAGTVFSIARRILRSNECAQEIVCDVFVYVWRNADAFDAGRGAVGAWLNIVTRNKSIDLVRKNRRHRLLNEQLWDAEEVNDFLRPEHVLSQFEEDSSVHAALSLLSPLRRHLLGLAFFDGLSHEEIAQALGIPLGTVKSHVRRALLVLRAAIVQSAGPTLTTTRPLTTPAGVDTAGFAVAPT